MPKMLCIWSPPAKNVALELKFELAGMRVQLLPISYSGFDKETLMHSMSGSPGRYIDAAIRRVQSSPELILVISPLVEERTHFECIVREISDFPGTKPTIFHSSNGIPLAYLLPRSLISAAPERSRFLRFLSAVEMAADQVLLARIGQQPVETRELRIEAPPLISPAIGFFVEKPKLALLEQARRAANALRKRNPGDSRWIAVLPFDAGDVLFAALALKRYRGDFSHLAVLKRFAPIARRIYPDLPLISIDCREDDATRRRSPEDEIFRDHVLPQLPADQPFAFLRPLRHHDDANYHFVDQIRFGLGDDLKSAREAFEFLPLRPLRKPKGKRILLHFAGGWDIKAYPSKWRGQLLESLTSAGYETSVLDQFPGLENFERTLEEHDLVVGVDSFPTHFANLIKRMPAIQLFGSTLISNATIANNSGLKPLWRGLECTPCHEISHCHRYHTDICLNYPRPEEILAEVTRSLR